VAAKRDYILKARNSEIPRALKQAGVGLVGLANNHMMDYTLVGLRDTLQAFHQAELPMVGAGFKLDAERPFILQKHGRHVALLAFSDVVPRNSGAPWRLTWGSLLPKASGTWPTPSGKRAAGLTSWF
jgi:poly-gamma-glutamate synthesis protein (capsule biosynthesis protein)